MNAAVPPCFLMDAARASPRSALRPMTATFAPAAARPSAIAPPSAPLAPMMTAISFVRSKRFISNRLGDRQGLRRQRADRLPIVRGNEFLVNDPGPADGCHV